MKDVVLIFDYDDTLVQTRECKFAAIQALGRRSYDISVDVGAIEEHWGKPYRQFFGDLFGMNGAHLDELLRRYELLNEEFPMQLHADAERLIRDVLPSYYCGIVSSASAARIASQLDSLGIPRDRFNFIQGAEHTPVHKPDPRVFEPVIAAIHNRSRKPDIIYVGDSCTDYHAAHGAGLRFIGVARKEHERNQLATVGAEFVTSLDEITALI
jgi:phosphoglycolate phosphatase